MPDFEHTLDHVARFAQRLDTLGWSGTSPFKAWVDSAPRTWLSRRRETALGSVRHLLSVRLSVRKTVERVETQLVSKSDVMIGGDDGGEAWDDQWDGDDAASVKLTASKEEASASVEEDDDASAWTMDDDQSGETDVMRERSDKDPFSNDEDVEAWGWDEEDPNNKVASPKKSTVQAPKSTTNGSSAENGRELTLRETYTVTAVPEAVLGIVSQVVSDAETLADPSFSATPIAPAASALHNLPTFVLAMYRATAPTSYAKLDVGNMLLYNDSSRLADELRHFVVGQIAKDVSSDLPITSRPSSRIRLDNDIKALDTFARRAYGSEMESQRTVLRDLLDGAQGFSNCTASPYSGECDSAVEMTVDRLREVYRQWRPVLSHSALLQSIGSLLGSVTAKMILDIEDLADIGEEESKQLRSYCDRVSTLRDLFTQTDPNGADPSDMTGIYCRNWFKFQYLAEILESSLADIKYLWTEGELSLEFEADEITELIQALFADSDYRRRAVADIRRSGR